jgi:hypothetical protein
MFSKEILQKDLEVIEHLRAQRAKCGDIINTSIRDLIESDNLSRENIEDEKSAIDALNDQFIELTKEIQLLEEQMFLNYTNEFTVNNLPQDPGKGFPHINTINK